MSDESSKKLTGRAKGGAARQAALTPEQRKENARKAALAKAKSPSSLGQLMGRQSIPLKLVILRSHATCLTTELVFFPKGDLLQGSE